jgi:HK97 family phage prohead protease
MDLETKFAKLEERAVKDDGTFSGYASKFNMVDQDGDIVLPGAFTKTLSARQPKMLWGHDTNKPIGLWDVVEVDSVGLRVEGKLLLTTAMGRETYELMKAGVVDGMSIGYLTRKSETRGGNRGLIEVDLYEISVVTFPMLEAAKIESVKSINDVILATKTSGDFAPLKRAVEGALRDAGFPAWLAKAQAALAPQALGDGPRDASASEIAKLIKEKFSFL